MATENRTRAEDLGDEAVLNAEGHYKAASVKFKLHFGEAISWYLEAVNRFTEAAKHLHGHGYKADKKRVVAKIRAATTAADRILDQLETHGIVL